MKLYLAHSSLDKSFVDRVAVQLGRHSVVYDKWSFNPGDPLLEAMQEGLENSDGFVLFASNRSLKSVWVTYELEEAEWRLATERLQFAMTVIVQGELETSDLPAWLTRSLVVSSPNPKHAARALVGEVRSRSDHTPTKLFMGREKDLSEMVSKLAPIDAPQPRLVVVHGLEGIGRRTLLRRAASDYLLLKSLIEVKLLENEGVSEFYIKLIDEARGLNTREIMAQEIAAFASLDVSDQIEELAKVLASLNETNEAVLLYDQGALLDDWGRYTELAMRLMEAIEEQEGTYLFLVQRRRPDLMGSAPSVPITLHQAASLSPSATEQLLLGYLKAAGVKSQAHEIRELAEYMGGYPPAIELAVTLIKHYGLPIVLADKSVLVGFLSRTFADALKRLVLPRNGASVLKMLAAFSSLPLGAISAAIGTSEEGTAAELRDLMDENLVELGEASLYAIATPIVRAVENVFGRPTTDDYEVIGKYLRETYWGAETPLPDLRVIDATLDAMARSNSPDLDSFNDILFPSLLERNAEKSYHSRDWSTAKSLAQRALDADPSRHRARRILFQAHVRRNEWPEAESVLEVIQDNNRREQFYLKGFMLWKRGQLNGAIIAFEEASSAGDRSPSVLRDRAHCLFRLGRTSEAWNAVREADGHFRENKFVVDLAAQIAIARHEYADAEVYIERLARLDNPENVAHRKATLLTDKGRLTEALSEAERATHTTSPRFEALAQMCDIYVRLGDPRAETAIKKLRPGSNAHHRDVQVGLEVKRLLRDGQHRRAALEWERLIDKGLPVHSALWAEILRQRISDPNVLLSVRKQAEMELDKMDNVVELPLAVDEVDAGYGEGE